MNSDQRGLRLGLVTFQDPTLLLIGDAGSFAWLAGELEAGRPVTLKSDADVEPIRLLLLPGNGGAGCARAGGVVEWHLSQREADAVATQLRELAGYGSPAHAYLDPEVTTAELQIVASWGEYDPARVFTKS